MTHPSDYLCGIYIPPEKQKYCVLYGIKSYFLMKWAIRRPRWDSVSHITGFLHHFMWYPLRWQNYSFLQCFPALSFLPNVSSCLVGASELSLGPAWATHMWIYGICSIWETVVKILSSLSACLKKPGDCSEEVPGFLQKVCFNLLALYDNCVQIHNLESPFYFLRVIWLFDRKKEGLW